MTYEDLMQLAAQAARGLEQPRLRLESGRALLAPRLDDDDRVVGACSAWVFGFASTVYERTFFNTSLQTWQGADGVQRFDLVCRDEWIEPQRSPVDVTPEQARSGLSLVARHFQARPGFDLRAELDASRGSMRPGGPCHFTVRPRRPIPLASWCRHCRAALHLIAHKPAFVGLAVSHWHERFEPACKPSDAREDGRMPQQPSPQDWRELPERIT